MRMSNRVESAVGSLDDLKGLEERIRDDPERFLSTVLPSRRARDTPGGAAAAAVAESPGAETAPPRSLATELDTELPVPGPGPEAAALVGAGASALAKVRSEGRAADFTPAELSGLEAIILLVGRPALLIQDGSFFPPPQEWSRLEASREQIERVCRSVGRIEVSGHPAGLSWVGTGFLVGDGVLMTNRHVAKEFCTWGGGGEWRFEEGMRVAVDYCEELGAATPREFAIEEVIGVHERLDLALLRVGGASPSEPAPEPLQIQATAPLSLSGRRVYVIGYPASDSRRNDPVEMRRIFSNIYDVKRLQPGEMTRHHEMERLFDHDCSTLGGNSGSAVVDLETHRVIGLHFGGRYLEFNRAVALWQLTGDPLLRRSALNFV